MTGTVIQFPRRYDEEPWLRADQLAAHFGVTTRTIRRWREAGMPSRLHHGRRRFRLSAAEAWRRGNAA